MAGQRAGTLMTAEEHMKNQLVVFRGGHTPEVLMNGRPEGFLALLDWLEDPADALECRGVSWDGAPAVTALVWCSTDSPGLTIRVHDRTLRFEGAGAAIDWMEGEVERLLADGREGVGHHLEHYPGHMVLSDVSVPLILSIEAETGGGFS